MDLDEYRIDKFLHITFVLQLAPLGLQTAVPRQAFSCCKITVLWIPINENFKTLKKLYLLFVQLAPGRTFRVYHNPEIG